MRRREFLTIVGGTAAAPMFAWRAARAQPAARPVIGFLHSGTADGYARIVAAFHEGLKETGYVEGQNVTFEYRWAENRYDRIPALAADLVGRQVTLIAANGPAAIAAKAATSTIPLVFFGGYDPVEAGLVTSLNRPGGNATGVNIMNVELAPKRLELARELIPTATIMAVMVNPANPNAKQLANDLQAAARSLGLQLHVLHARTEQEIDAAFAALPGLRASALVIGSDPLFNTRSEQFAALTLRERLPAIYQYPEFTAAGGLMSYGGSITDLYRRVGAYVGRILKGEKPADLPVQQSTKVELFINLKTAKALGITVPLSLLGRADEVIE
jgi:putative ABC transport system substrate-binding protein